MGLFIRDYFAEKKQIRDETAQIRDETARLRTKIEEENARQHEENARQREALEKENARQREALEKTLEKFRSDILLKVVLEKTKLDPKAIEYIQQDIVEATKKD